MEENQKPVRRQPGKVAMADHRYTEETNTLDTISITSQINNQKPRASQMDNRKSLSNLGIYVYGACAMVLGLIGLVWGDFAGGWQRVGDHVPLRTPLAYLTGLLEVAGGTAIFFRRSARIGAALLTAIYSIFALLWVPQVIAAPRVYDGTGNFFEEFSLVVGGFVALAALSPAGSAWARNESRISRVFTLSVISFGIVQVIDLPGLSGFIPNWIPARVFWSYATTVGLFLAAVSIGIGVMAPLAARLLTVMVIAFDLCWIDRVIAQPKEHFNWAGNGISLVIAAATWVVSDSISRHAADRKQMVKVGEMELSKSA
jgi:uncharacterized membrane protein YphA (DoxX/SURF4 family)